jgi:hypothetical protein
MSLMDNVSRPLIALLVGTVAFFALWITALKPSSSGSRGASSTAYQSAIAKARQAVGISGAASVAHGGTVVSSPPPSASTTAASAARTPVSSQATNTTASPPTNTTATQSTTPAAAAKPSASPAQRRIDRVTRALLGKRVVALLFYNPAATDDRAVEHELAAVPSHGRKVLKLAVPLAELTRYPVVTTQVPVNESPTLVVIDGQGEASTIVGFADRFEIAQRVLDALAAK